MASRTMFWALFSVLVLCWSVATSSEVEDESEFNYHEDSVRGPARWGELRSERPPHFVLKVNRIFCLVTLHHSPLPIFLSHLKEIHFVVFEEISWRC
ncbi:hypothetical protein MLD38_028817 [Melastoma candidum]|uniref:Uncharacterized protein n=1 Tax=Melastoma candidum TaxID=119954 RepID=A0ACB9N1T7_9MYRT|nr:hypothetical protein MLD38_028817 [Melastoma candidum]